MGLRQRAEYEKNYLDGWPVFAARPQEPQAGLACHLQYISMAVRACHAGLLEAREDYLTTI
jgi:hypothetical protein